MHLLYDATTINRPLDGQLDRPANDPGVVARQNI